MAKYSYKSRLAAFFTALIIMLTVVSPVTIVQAADSFETSIASFPNSYKPYLRQIHKNHPKWKFVPVKTGLDFYGAVTAQQSGNKSLVSNYSVYTNLFKSVEPGDYNFSTGKYIEKDSGFVTANKMAIAYYMDPRNFLYDRGIFLFEDLSFDSSLTVKAVESTLKGTFMENAYTNYYDSNGKLHKTTNKYSSVIYNAGKTYDVNPCYLAAKIICEVGPNGGSGTSGRNKTYPGYYNFYNIGAYSSSNPILKALKYAAGGTTYQRPWNTKEKAIKGGAQFISESYISKGQTTGYFQRFNVVPGAYYETHTHQYMTDISGAVNQAYKTYKSYLDNGLIDMGFIFSIPVYDNMPGSANMDGKINNADAFGQTAVLNGDNSAYNVRKDASTESDKYDFQLSSGKALRINGYSFTTSRVNDNVQRYPYWANVDFTYNSKEYTGYIYSNFLTLKTHTTVPKGKYTPIVFKTNNSLDYKYISSNPSIAKVINDKEIQFLKNGTVTITAYDSIGNYETIGYKVASDSGDYKVQSVKVSGITAQTAKVSFKKNSKCTDYEVCLVQGNKLIKRIVTDKTSVSLTSLQPKTDYKVYVRGLKQSGTTKLYSVYTSPVSFTSLKPEPPAKVTGLTAKANGYTAVKLNWTKVADADGYTVYTYNSGTKKYTSIANVTANSYNDKNERVINKTVYAVRAYKTAGDEKVYGSYSARVTYNPPKVTLSKPASFKQSSASSTSVSLSWGAVKNAQGYQVYRYSNSKKAYEKIKTVTGTSCTVNSLSSLSSGKYKVRAYLKIYSKTVYSSYSAEITAKSGPAAVKGVSQSGTNKTSYTLKWNKVKDATGYRVYKYDTKAKEFKKLKDVTGTSLKITGLSAGSSAKYKVKAYLKQSSGLTPLWGTASAVFTAVNMPNTPGTPSQSAATATSVTLKWNKSSGANGYRVYKYDSKSKTYKKLKDVTGTSLKVTGLSAGKSYKFKVKAYTKNSAGTLFWGTVSKASTVIAAPKTVSGLSQTGTTKTALTLKWGKATGAKGYRVYKYDSKSKTYKKLKDVTGTSLKITGLSAGKSYKFKVKAYTKNASGKFVWGASSSIFTAATQPDTVSSLSQSNTAKTSLTLKWKKVTGAKGYRVYKYDSKSKTYKKLKDVTGTSLKITGLSAGKSYKFKVKAYTKNSASKIFWGTLSKAFTAKTK